MLREILKRSAMWGYRNVYRPIPRRVLGLAGRQRVVVLLYHRVSDQFRDSVTVGVSQFEQQMRFLRKNYSMVDVEDLLRGNVCRRASTPLIGITFDDGYLDNYEIAFPILKKYDIPATFFVSTGMIGTDKPFDHDLEKLGRGVPAMNWDHIVKLHENGFKIGSHTVNHINCAASNGETLKSELRESKQMLTRKLNISDVMFAYPFGGRGDITPIALDQVKETGFIGCFSACAGYVGTNFDRFDVPRMNINFNYSMGAFKSAIEGYFWRR